MDDDLCIMNYGLWTMDYPSMQNYEVWVMDHELWPMDYGLWTLNAHGR